MAKGTLTVRLIGDAKPLNDTLKGVGSKLGKFAAGVATAAAGASAVLVTKGIQAAREAEKINRITEQVIESTGGAANVTAKQVDELSGRLQKLTGVSDETIQRGSNMLLTFTNVRNEVGKNNDIFDQATGLALDMSVAMGTDVKDSAIQLGKALNDPIKGVSALSRVGVQFTEQQKDQIETLVESGDVLGAQKLILEELGTQFGGTAEAAADPMQKLQSTIGDVVETVGVALLPVFDQAANWLAEKLPGAMDATIGFVKDKLIPVFVAVKGWWDENSPAILETVRTLWETVSSAFRSAADVVSDVVDRVRGFIDQFRDRLDENSGEVSGWFEKAKEILGKVVETFQSAFEAVKTVVETAITILTEAWDRFGEHIVDFAGRWLGRVITVVSEAFDVLKGIFDLVTSILTGDWAAAWEAIKEVVSSAFTILKTLVSNAFDLLKTAFGLGVAAISQVWSGLWEGIKDGFKAAINWIIDKWNALEFTLPSIEAFGQTIGGATIGVPKLQKLHTGGMFHAPTPGGEGLALLRDREIVVTPEQQGMGGVDVEQMARAFARELVAQMRVA